MQNPIMSTIQFATYYKTEYILKVLNIVYCLSQCRYLGKIKQLAVCSSPSYKNTNNFKTLSFVLKAEDEKTVERVTFGETIVIE